MKGNKHAAKRAYKKNFRNSKWGRLAAEAKKRYHKKKQMAD